MNEEIILLPDFLDFDVYPLNDFYSEDLKGNNHQKTLIVLGLNSQSPANEQFLAKIIAAVQYNLIEDTLIYTFHPQSPIPFASICQNYAIKKVIFFDITLKDLGIHLQFPKYRVVNWNNLQILDIDSLSKIEQNKALKGELWNALKVMFL
jgi:hypothetical protein